MGSDAAPVIWIGRVLPRRYLAKSAQDGWSFGGRRLRLPSAQQPPASPRVSALPATPRMSVRAASPRVSAPPARPRVRVAPKRERSAARAVGQLHLGVPRLRKLVRIIQRGVQP